MERVVKFRGKVVNHDPMTNPENGWVEGYYLQDLDNGVVKHYIFNCPCRWEVVPDTIGQFTGLLDKNGKEIYEGDIIRGNCGNGEVRHLISFYDMIASFVAEMLPDNDISDYCSLSQIWILKYNKEVIGNIHDNPNLLTDGRD